MFKVVLSFLPSVRTIPTVGGEKPSAYQCQQHMHTQVKQSSETKDDMSQDSKFLLKIEKGLGTSAIHPS